MILSERERRRRGGGVEQIRSCRSYKLGYKTDHRVEDPREQGCQQFRELIIDFEEWDFETI